jgi:hypothetical protein
MIEDGLATEPQNPEELIGPPGAIVLRADNRNELA